MRLLRAVVRFTTGFAIGFVLGYAAAMLWTPCDGASARLALHGEAERLPTRPREVLQDARHRVRHAVDEGRKAAAEARAELEASSGLYPT